MVVINKRDSMICSMSGNFIYTRTKKPSGIPLASAGDDIQKIGLMRYFCWFYVLILRFL